MIGISMIGISMIGISMIGISMIGISKRFARTRARHDDGYVSG
jgi:hypothetical protein